MSGVPGILGPYSEGKPSGWRWTFTVLQTGARRRGSRVVTCPECGTPAAIHWYLDGRYQETELGRRYVRLGDGSWGRSRRGNVVPLNHESPDWRRADAGATVRGAITAAPTVAHCLTASCGGRRIAIDRPPDEP